MQGLGDEREGTAPGSATVSFLNDIVFIEGAHLVGQEGLSKWLVNVVLWQAAHSHARCLSERQEPSQLAFCSSTVRR